MCLISRINVVLIKNFTQKKNNNSRVTSSPLRLPRVVKKCYGNVIKDIVIEIRRETGHFYSWTSDMLNCLVPSSIVTDWYKMGLLRKATHVSACWKKPKAVCKFGSYRIEKYSPRKWFMSSSGGKKTIDRLTKVYFLMSTKLIICNDNSRLLIRSWVG